MKNNLLIIFLSFIPYCLSAADFRAEGSVIIDQPVYHDLYIAGGTVVINAPVYGDLIVTGGKIQVNDTVSQDILAFGGEITIKKYVGDDVRCAGGKVVISGYVAGDVVMAAGDVLIDAPANIESLTATGGILHLNGTIRQDVDASCGNFQFSGATGGDVNVKADEILINGIIHGKSNLAATKGIFIGGSARFGRSIHYWQPFEKPLKLPPSAEASQPVYDLLLSISHSRWYFLGATTALGFLWYCSMALALIMIFQYLFPKTLARAGQNLTEKPGKSTFAGALVLIGIPIAAIICMITIIGVPVGAILSVFYFILLLLATVISAIVIANWIYTISKSPSTFLKITLTALFIFMLLKIISLTPFLGWLLMIIITAGCFGALALTFQWRKQQRL